MFTCYMYYVNNNLARYLNSWVLFFLKTFFICFSLNHAMKCDASIILFYVYISPLCCRNVFFYLIVWITFFPFCISIACSPFLFYLANCFHLPFSFAFKGVVSNTSSVTDLVFKWIAILLPDYSNAFISSLVVFLGLQFVFLTSYPISVTLIMFIS